MQPLPKIDVHGLNSEQALSLVRYNLYEFYNRGYKEVYIIHGHGKGILKIKIRQMLKNFSFVKKLKKAPENQGGDGVTIVEFVR
ncbi:MAG: Smr/MutS family protein [Candidatus Woesearchaeota archaeon]